MAKNLVQPNDYTTETAPDGSLVQPLTHSTNASLCKGALAPAAQSQMVRHKTVEELWLISAGYGEFCCESVNAGQPFPIMEGTSFTIPPGCWFQFRNTGNTALEFVIATIPPWTGDEEAEVSEQDMWQ